MPPKTKGLWVPQPAAKLYGAGGSDPETVRDKMVEMVGEATVQKAELSVVLDLLFLNGVIRPSEFVELMMKKIHRIDERRRAAARLEEDRG